MAVRGLVQVSSFVVPRECSRPAAWAGCVLILAAAVGYTARLNSSSLLGPDSGDYVVLARSLATGHGYRLVSELGWPVHTLRPPGLPLLLVPAAWAAPYSMVAAKILVVALSVVSLVALWKLATELLGVSAGLAATTLVATSPYMLVFATEVLSENAYLCLTLAGLILLGQIDKGSAATWVWITCGLVLGAAALVRTAGITLLVPASVLLVLRGCFGGTGTSEAAPGGSAVSWKAWAAAVALAWAPLAAWTIRNVIVRAPVGYWQNLGAQEGQNLAARFVQVPLANIPYYLGRLGWMAAPEVWPDHSLLAELVPLGPPWLAGRWGVVVGAVILALALVGLWSARRAHGWVPLVYVGGYLGMLALYTFQSLRFLWPVWPVLLIYALAGGGGLLVRIGDAVSRWRTSREVGGGDASQAGSSKGVGVGLAALLLVLGVMLVGQAWMCGDIVRTNLWSALWPDDFYSRRDRLDLLYYADVRAAGQWLREHTAANTRVLTADSGFYGVSRRQQQFDYLETLGAAGVADRLRQSRASYVVVADHGELPRDFSYTDGAAYRFEEVYKRRMVRIYRVRPNLEGTVELDQPLSIAELNAIAERLRKVPVDSHVGLQLMQVLASEGAADVAVETGLRGLESGVELINLTLAVAGNLVYAGRYEDAIRYAEEARHLQEAEFHRSSIEATILAARAFLRRDDERLSPRDRGRASLQIVGAYMASGQLRHALEEVERAYKLAPELPEVQFARGRLLDLLGRREEALRMLEQAAAAGEAEAAQRAAAYHWSQVIEAGKPKTLTLGGRRFHVNPDDPQEHVRLADLWTASGHPGRALAVMIRAAARFPNDALVHVDLGTRYAMYGLFDEAIAALERAVALRPNDLRSRARLGQVVEASQVPPPP